jgi:Na+/H+-dicarboxylate symporter
MDRVQLALVIGVCLGLFFGGYLARKSSQEETIYGGRWAKTFHFVGAASMGGVLPLVLASLVLGLGFTTAFPLALSFLLVAWIALMLYALFERPARKGRG